MKTDTHTLLFGQKEYNNSNQSVRLNSAVIGIGSNICPETNISGMLNVLGEKVTILRYSTFLKTKPIGIENQADFINGAVKIETNLNREALNHVLKNIEDIFKRDRSTPKFGPRTIDLDLVVWNDEIVDKDYFSRDFLKQNVDEVRDAN
jgi:2-amino-4-hydroxy-6-hydroxymethyldihydropteridine diphosphokinase